MPTTRNLTKLLVDTTVEEVSIAIERSEQVYSAVPGRAATVVLVGSFC